MILTSFKVFEVKTAVSLTTAYSEQPTHQRISTGFITVLTLSPSNMVVQAFCRIHCTVIDYLRACGLTSLKGLLGTFAPLLLVRRAVFN